MEISKIAKERIVTILYAIFLWATKASSSTKSPHKGCPNLDHKNVGLTTIIYPKKGSNWTNKIVHSSTIASKPPSARLTSFFSLPPLSSCSSWSSSTTGDLIGTESGVFLSSGEDSLASPLENVEARPMLSRQSSSSSSSRFYVSKNRDLAPPISLLQREGKSEGPISWCLSREYADGRLILRNAWHNDNDCGDTMNCCGKIDEENGENDGEIVENNEENRDRSEIFSSRKEGLLDNMGNNANEISFAASVTEESMQHELKVDVGNLRKCVSYPDGWASFTCLDPSHLPIPC